MEIGISKLINETELEEHLREFLKTKSVFISNNINELSQDQDYFVSPSDTNYQGFPMGIEFYRYKWDEKAYIYMLQKIAESIGKKFSCQCIVEAGHYAPDDAPYWFLLFGEDGWYLADEWRIEKDIPNDDDEETFKIVKRKFIATKLECCSLNDDTTSCEFSY